MEQPKSNKSRNMMYTQQITHLPFPLDELEARLKALNPEKYAFVVHDKDTAEDGQPAEAHVHAMLTFTNPRSLNSVAKTLGDKPQYIERYDKQADNGYSYLTHRTDKAKSKHQYDFSEVTASFDYPAYMADIESKVLNATKYNQTKLLLDAFKAGHITKQELEQRLTGSEYGRLKPQIENIHSIILRQKADEWRKEVISQGKTLQVIWIYGDAGTGKSSLAKQFVRKKGLDCFISGSSNDTFQSYNGEHSAIIDDFRPRIMLYADLLRITDPYSIEHGVNVPSRYYDKALSVELIIITSPYSPYHFYLESVSKHKRDIDTFAQLNRRIALTLYCDMDYIYQSKFDTATNEFIIDITTKQPNKLSQKARPKPIGQRSEDIFKKIFE